MKDMNYYRAISNTLNSTIQQSEFYEVQNAMLYDFDRNPSCKTVLLNDEIINAILWIDTDIVTGGKSYKIRCKPNQELKIGDILTIDDEIWFITKVEIDKMISYSATLAKATCILKFFQDGIYRELPCYITVGTRNYINEKDNEYIRTPKSLYTGYCPDLGYLNKQDVNKRFIIRGYVYRAVGIDNLTVLDNEVRDGLIIIKFQDDAICDDDNMELEIADYYTYMSDEDAIMPISTFSLKRNEAPIKRYNLSIDCDRDELFCGENITIHSSIKNNENNEILTSREFYVTDDNDKAIKYATIENIDNKSIKLKVNKSSKYIGKKIKLKVVCPQLKDVQFEKVFTISSIL